ncbi:MAG: hypothetical protein J6T10_22940 [Methanobrevibacter sp.]|nr:hypothetical protein [Methanobrevibacter sp.]
MNKQETINAIKQEAKKQATERVSMTKEEIELNKECFEAASMPIDFKDDDLKLGVGELDIRGLKEKNYKQVMFRLLAIQTSQTRQLTQVVIDMERLLMILLGQMGINPEEIGTRINTLIEKLTKESEKITRDSQKN